MIHPASAPASTIQLPPLILHPFADATGPNRLVESSRASLMLQGLLPSGDRTQEDLDRILLDGRYCELRMLFYVGRDLLRWLDQSLECVRRQFPDRAGLSFQSFTCALIDDTPTAVQEKLRRWGVADYRAIFTRAIGLNILFKSVPERDQISDAFVRNYHRYAEAVFTSHQHLSSFTTFQPGEAQFELYASGEYSRMLEQQWEKDE